MKIVLIGYRGSGKTTVGKILSKVLGLRFISTDEEIVKKTGKSIPEIVKNYGWEKFRDIETEIAKSLSDEDNIIIDTGGGIVLRDENVRALKRNGIVIFLSAPPEVLAERIKDDSSRPPLKLGRTHWDEVKEVLEERLPYYRKAMDIEISTEGKTPEEVSEEIIKILQNEKG